MTNDLVLYTRVSKGCYIDGSFGLDHCRKRLVQIMQKLAHDLWVAGAQYNDFRARALLLEEELQGDPTDDDSETLEAVELMNEFCAGGMHFEFEAGDLILFED